MRTPVLRLLSALTALALVAGCSVGSSLVSSADVTTEDSGRANETSTFDGGEFFEDSLAVDGSASELMEKDMTTGWQCVEASDCVGLEKLPECRQYHCTEDHLCQPVDAPDGAPCQPTDICFDGGTCAAAICVGDVLAPCDDENPCTVDLCDPGFGCTVTPLSGLCDDGNECTADDECTDSVCTGTAIDCDDKNPCTADSCDPKTGCLHTNQDGECQDGDPCTIGDTCVGGGCAAAENICECYEDADCAAYLFEPCVLSVICTTGDPPFVCEVTTLDCEDTGSICSTAQCNPDLGECESIPTNEGEECLEPTNCVSVGLCQEGSCVGESMVCEDDNSCTVDGCVPGEGCQFVPAILPCDDNDPCTINDFCNLDGECQGLDTGCQELPTLGLKLTSLIFEQPSFCLPSPIPGQPCTDATALVNSFIDDDIQSAESPLVMLALFAPFDLDGDQSSFSLGPGSCDYDNDGEATDCNFDNDPASMEPVTYQDAAQCLTDAGQVSAAPCFHVAGDAIEVGVMDIVIPISKAEITGTFLGMPDPGQVAQGHIQAFLQKSVTDTIKVTLPLMQPYKMSELLDPEGLVTIDGEAGWPLLIHYTAATVPVWVGE
jgi:hypothetical protein